MALSADKRRVISNASATKSATLPVAASQTIYRGALLCMDADGYVIPAADTAGLAFVGVAAEFVDNSAGSDGDKEVVCEWGQTEEVDASGLAQTQVGKLVVVSDDATVTDAAAATNDVACGRLVKFTSGTSVALIEIAAYANASA